MAKVPFAFFPSAYPGIHQTAHRPDHAHGHRRNMSRTGDNIRIPLKEEDAIRAFFKVKPTADMPRPGAQPMKAKRKRAKKK
jgi:hypothetical protein